MRFDHSVPEMPSLIDDGVLVLGGVEHSRTELCPEASQHPSLIGIAKAWPTPCILVQAQLGLKRGESLGFAQGTLGFHEAPKEVLRVCQVSPNDPARSANLVIFPNMRVPERSIIYKVFAGTISSS